MTSRQIRKIRKQTALTLERFGKEFNPQVTHSSVWLWEHGARPGRAALARLVELDEARRAIEMLRRLGRWGAAQDRSVTTYITQGLRWREAVEMTAGSIGYQAALETIREAALLPR
jgi:hypothetical protein